MAKAETGRQDHVLYHFKYSICSIMARYTFACRGKPRIANHEISITEVDVDIEHEEQLTEHFLCNVNEKGEVPVLVRPGHYPMPESVDISYYFADSYPDLIPPTHEDEIKRLIASIHSISFFSLTFTGKPFLAHSERNYLLNRLDNNPSDRYRAVIETKLGRIDNRMFNVLTDSGVNENIQFATTLLREFEAIIMNSETNWCFGFPRPSVLDAHLVVFIARLLDVKRDNMVPELIQEYAKNAMAGPEWQSVMQGRMTIPAEYL